MPTEETPAVVAAAPTPSVKAVAPAPAVAGAIDDTHPAKSVQPVVGVTKKPKPATPECFVVSRDERKHF